MVGKKFLVINKSKPIDLFGGMISDINKIEILEESEKCYRISKGETSSFFNFDTQWILKEEFDKKFEIVEELK
jgi:hypothetical protein